MIKKIRISPGAVLSQYKNNYYHFLLDQIFSLYVFMRRNKLLGANPLLLCTHQSIHDDFFKLFTEKEIQYVEQSLTLSSDEVLLDEGQMFLGRELIVEEAFKNKSITLTGPKYTNKELRCLLNDFRAYLLQRWKLELPKRKAQNITIVKRRNKRGIVNGDELLEVVKSFRYPVKEVYLEDLSYREQAQIMLKTAVLIGSHGAGLANALFLPKGAILIEINPFGFKSEVFKNLARTVGFHDIQIFGEYGKDLYLLKASKIIMQHEAKVGPVTADNSPFPSSFEFRRYIRSQNIRIDPFQLRVALKGIFSLRSRFNYFFRSLFEKVYFDHKLL